MNKIFSLVAPLPPPPPPPASQEFFFNLLVYLMCFGVRFSLYLASWLSDFDLFFSVCVVFGPLVFPQKMGGGGQGTLAPPPPGSAPGTGWGVPLPRCKENGN